MANNGYEGVEHVESKEEAKLYRNLLATISFLLSILFAIILIALFSQQKVEIPFYVFIGLGFFCITTAVGGLSIISGSRKA